jgi:hypothetical protein
MRGTHAMKPLLTESGEPLSMEGDALFRAQYSSGSVREGRLLWVSGDGVAHATELSTGRTHTVREGLPTIAPSRSLFSFSGEHLVTLAPLEPGTDPDLVIRRLSDWQEVRRIRIPLLATIQSRTMLLRDFAIRPGFLT